MIVGVPTRIPRPQHGSVAYRSLAARTSKYWREMVDNDCEWEKVDPRVIRHFSRRHLDQYFRYRSACMKFRVAFAVLAAPQSGPVSTDELFATLSVRYAAWFTRGEFYDACTIVARIVNGPGRPSIRLVESQPDNPT
jgi:hypothetical protein